MTETPADALADGDPTPDPFRGEDGDPVVPDGWTHDVVEANGIAVSYYRAGPDAEAAAATVVVAHGMFEDARCKRFLVDALADDGYDVVAHDARGHGHTDAPESGYAPANRVADLLEILDALDVDAPVLYGHSMGGATVAKAAADHPDRVRGVVMEDPAAMRGPPDFDLDDVADGVAADVRDDLASTFDELLATYEDPDDDPAAAADEVPPALSATFARSDQRQSEHVAEIARTGYPAFANVFPEITVPALLLRRDHATTPDAHRDGTPVQERVADLELADALPDGRLVHVPGAGHHVVLTARDAALAELRAFLARLDHDDDTDRSGT
jgi:pimeloyl-ACP methyl ester carboxylesterase